MIDIRRTKGVRYLSIGKGRNTRRCCRRAIWPFPIERYLTPFLQRPTADSRGFTLLEVLLALSIFSLIALATVRQITLIRNTKDQALAQMDLYNGARAALSIIRSDVGQAFHVLYDDLGEETKAAILQGQPVPHTIFDGRKASLVFTSLSHRVYYKGRRESEQTEISYFLQPKRGAKTASLMKREAERIDSDLFQGGQVYTILDNVTSLEFQFWDPTLGRWTDDWNSDSGNTRDKFPHAIKVKLAILDPKTSRELKFETNIKVAFLNNDKQLVTF